MRETWTLPVVQTGTLTLQLKLTLFMKAVNSTSSISQSAGLPNITGRVVTDNYPAGPDMIPDGCFTKVETYGTFKEGGTGNYTLPSTCNFNASSSSTIYGSSNTVTPLSRKCLFLIRY